MMKGVSLMKPLRKNMSEIKISKQELERLQDRDFKLSCLEQGGVDNWEWYGESLSEYFKKEAVEELEDDFIECLNDILSEADVDYPAGRGAGHSITFDEGAVKKLLSRFLKAIGEIEND